MPCSKVLLVDDEAGFVEAVAAELKKRFDFTGLTSPQQALQVLESENWDAVVIDIKMPVMSGIELFTAMKKKRPEGCYIFLTQLLDDLTALSALKLGPDDYINKPVSAERLAALIENRICKHRDRQAFRFSDLTFDVDASMVFIGEECVELTKKEAQILHALLRSQEKKLQREKLIKLLWGSASVTSQTLDTHLWALRKKIKDSSVTILSDRDRYVCLKEE